MAQPYLLDPAAVMTSEVSGGGSGGPKATGAAAPTMATGPFSNASRHSNWRLWGKWGPLDAEVNQRRLFNIHRFLEERILTTDREVPGRFFQKGRAVPIFFAVDDYNFVRS